MILSSGSPFPIHDPDQRLTLQIENVTGSEFLTSFLLAQIASRSGALESWRANLGVANDPCKNWKPPAEKNSLNP